MAVVPVFTFVATKTPSASSVVFEKDRVPRETTAREALPGALKLALFMVKLPVVISTRGARPTRKASLILLSELAADEIVKFPVRIFTLFDKIPEGVTV